MAVTRVLKAVFGTSDDKEALMTIPHIKDDAGQSDVKEFMDSVIAADIFNAGLTSKIGAKVVETETTVLFG
ncbi:MAG: DUF2922 domain-containing protein [Synergistaceae bacterium]|jgi:hypothetical protein|nr:DUF2922 domain-containing protein [Synergistaceae bacterium]